MLSERFKLALVPCIQNLMPCIQNLMPWKHCNIQSQTGLALFIPKFEAWLAIAGRTWYRHGCSRLFVKYNLFYRCFHFSGKRRCLGYKKYHPWRNRLWWKENICWCMFCKYSLLYIFSYVIYILFSSVARILVRGRP